MATKAALTVEEYLHTSFPDLDKEYRDGELVEKTLLDHSHSSIQGDLIVFFGELRKRLSVFVYAELRLKVRPGLYLIPDVCVRELTEAPSLHVPELGCEISPADVFS